MPSYVLLLVGLALGAAVGLVAGAALVASRFRGVASRADERAHAAEVAAAADRAALEIERTSVAARVEEARAAAQADSARLAAQFEALAAQALRHNNEAFLSLADQRLRASAQAQSADLAQRTAEVEQLVSPIRQTLDKVAASITASDQARAASHSSLLAQVRLATETSQTLQAETRTLVNALKAPQARGAWGEMQLRRVVELSGMVEHVDFETQVTRRTDDGVVRPDLVIHLAGGKHIVVDAKVSLAAFLEGSQTDDPVAASARLAAHARHLRDHVGLLASKAYWRQFSTAPDFVVLFVPGESILVHALEADPGLQEYAMEQQVIIATPSTLLTILRSVGYAWSQAQLTEHARTVFDLGRELYDRLGTLGTHVDKLGRSISTVVTDYNKAVGSLETRVLSSARKLKELRVVDAGIDAPRSLDQAMVRPVSSPELVADTLGSASATTPLELELTDDRYGVLPDLDVIRDGVAHGATDDGDPAADSLGA